MSYLSWILSDVTPLKSNKYPLHIKVSGGFNPNFNKPLLSTLTKLDAAYHFASDNGILMQ